jgi:hypothetical protein
MFCWYAYPDVFRPVDLLIAQLVEICPEVVIRERLAAAVVEYSAALPLDLLNHVHCVPLLMDAVLHGLPIRVANL